MQDHATIFKLFGTSAGAALVTFLPALDIILRICASTAAIISGTLGAVVAIRALRRK